jgi:predicted nucleic acid-binding protein
MIAEAFVDTNILVYAAAGKDDQPEKYERAWDLINAGRFGLSGQVLAEFFVNVTKTGDRRPLLEPLPLHEAAAWIDRLKVQPVVPVDADLVCDAIRLSGRYQINYWDAALIAGAERLEVPTLYTEDLNHGQLYGSVKVVNPFEAN